MIQNVHQRELRTSQHQLGQLVDQLAGPDDPLWPRGWPPLLLDRAASAVGDPPARPAQWSPWVRLWRRLLRTTAPSPG